MTIQERCSIHADKMQGEGWYVTANVLAEAAARLERYEIALRTIALHCPSLDVTGIREQCDQALEFNPQT